MLNMRSEEYNTVFYSHFARFMNRVTLNMHMFLSDTGLTRVRVNPSQEYVNTYSTC